MDIGIYGMGRMGFNMARRLVDKGYHRVIVGNRSPGKLNEAVERGAEGAYSVEDSSRSRGPLGGVRGYLTGAVFEGQAHGDVRTHGSGA